MERLKRVAQADDLIRAISDNPADEPLQQFSADLGISCVSGDENDVLSRYVKALDEHPADAIVRITADCPLIDPAVIDRVISEYREGAASVHIEDGVINYISALVQATRTSPRLRLGCSPRGAQFIAGAARVQAWLESREYVIPDDVKSIAQPVLRHRLLLDPEAQLEGWTTDRVIEELLTAVPATDS